MRRVFVTVALAGCSTSEPNATLSELPRLGVGLEAIDQRDSNDDTTRPTELVVTLDYDITQFRSDHDGVCATIDTTVRASFNGVKLALIEPGRDEDDFGGCFEPRLSVTIPLEIGGEGELFITDGTRTVVASYGELVVARVATLRSHDSWRFARGEDVAVAWSHPAELADVPDNIYFQAERSFFDMAHLVVGDELHFTIPVAPPVRGAGTIVFEATRVDGIAASCDGADSCPFSASRSYQHAVDVD